MKHWIRILSYDSFTFFYLFGFCVKLTMYAEELVYAFVCRCVSIRVHADFMGKAVPTLLKCVKRRHLPVWFYLFVQI